MPFGDWTTNADPDDMVRARSGAVIDRFLTANWRLVSSVSLSRPSTADSSRRSAIVNSPGTAAFGAAAISHVATRPAHVAG